MTRIGVVRLLAGFVRAAKAHQIRGDDPVACARKDRDHVTVEVGPCGFPVHQQNGGGMRVAFIDVMQAQGAALGIVQRGVVRGEIVIRQVFKTYVRGAQAIHERLLWVGCFMVA